MKRHTKSSGKIPGHSPETILVYVGLDLMGDGLMKLPFIRALRQNFPQAYITWLAGKGPSAFAGMLSPLVKDLIDEVVDEANFGRKWNELFQAPLSGTSLEGRHFDLILDTQRRVLTTLILKRVPHRLFVSGVADYWLSDRRPATGRKKPASMIRQLLSLIEVANNTPITGTAPSALATPYEQIAKELLPAGPIYLGLAPGAGGRNKCWPLEHYIELAERQYLKGHVPVVFLGPAEAVWAEKFTANAPHALLPLQSDAARKFNDSPLATIALGQRLAVAVANDSGTGHMLAAADIPLVSLFGPTSPDKFAPLVSRGKVITAQHFGGEGMAAIPLAAVEDAIEDLLGLDTPN